MGNLREFHMQPQVVRSSASTRLQSATSARIYSPAASLTNTASTRLLHTASLSIARQNRGYPVRPPSYGQRMLTNINTSSRNVSQPIPRKSGEKPTRPAQVSPLQKDLNILFPDFHTLIVLDLGKDSTDSLLVALASHTLPQLQSLSCANSKRLTDQGVLALAGVGESDRPWDTRTALAYLDGIVKAPVKTFKKLPSRKPQKLFKIIHPTCLVRSAEDLKSEEVGRLQEGATVSELETKGSRMHFKKEDGEGPSEGWFSTTLHGKSTVQSVAPEPKAALKVEIASSFPSLQEIDLTFCPKTSYAMTLALRRLLPSLTLIRRISDWTTGVFETPFAVPGQPIEVHRYWADGTFVFGRNEQSKGYIVDEKEYKPGQVSTSIQYLNFDTKGHWDPWAEFLYRPGVTMLRGDGQTDHAKGSRSDSILVFQACDGMYAPSQLPPNPHSLAPQPGKCCSLTREGDEVSSNLQFGPDGLENPIGDPISKGRLLFSNMRVRPLPPEELMPPDNVVQANIRYILDNQWPTLDLKSMEREVHKAFGGNRADERAWLA